MKFDTRDKKPKIWNVAILSAAMLLAVAVLAAVGGDRSVTAVCVVMDAYFAAVIVLLMRAFFMQLEYNPYSYNVIYYLGFSVYVLIMLAFSVVFTARVFADPSRAGMGQFVLFLNGAFRNLLYVVSAFALPFSAVLALSNVALVLHDRFRIINLLGFFLAALLAGGTAFVFSNTWLLSENPGAQLGAEIAVSLVASFFLYFECMMIGTVAAALIAAFHEPDPDKDVLIILGYSLKDGETSETVLQARVDRAVRFRERQLRETGKDLLFIPSGGNGTEESPSESRWMHDCLLRQGVPENRIIEENRSTTTHENMIFSKEIIREACPGGKIAFTTSNYHVFRSGLYARRVKMRAVGIGAKTKWYFWPNASVREFAAILSEHRLKQALILLGLAAVNVILVLMAYGVLGSGQV